MDFHTWQYLLRYSLGKPGALRAYRQAIKNQSLSADELAEISWQKTQRLLAYAYKNVNWYHNSFKYAGLLPEDIRYPEDYNKVPVLTRKDIVDNFEQFISSEISPSSLKITTTGGSTGTPLKLGMQRNGLRELHKWQMFSWWGLSPGIDKATAYRNVPVNRINKIALALIHWPQKVVKMDATNINEEGISEFIQRIIDIKPRLVHGYVGALDIVADYILEKNISIFPPEVVWVTASPINTLVETKISKAFKASVVDQYGCSEIYFIAAECPCKQGLHIFSDSVRVEFLNEQNQAVNSGEYGKIVLTNLDEYHFPLIRYENGDTGRFLNKQCNCGMSLPLMDKVKGRISENLLLPDKTVLAGEYLTTIFDDFTDDVRQFQIVQHQNLDISVYIVFQSGAKNQKAVISVVEGELQKRIKNQVRLDFTVKSGIPVTRGKLQFIIKE